MTDYPHIAFKKRWQLTAQSQFALGQCQAIVAAISEMPLRPEYHQRLLGVSLQKGAQATTAIEGNTLTQEEVAKVARGEPLPPSKEYQEREVANVLEAMNTVLREVARESRGQRITPALLLRFHATIGRELGSHFEAIPGQFRTDERVVGSYRCPKASDVPGLVEQLCRWLAEEFRYSSGDQDFTDAVLQAIISHVYLEWIHPFGDGNGRTGRLLEFYILLRAGIPDIASHILSNFYNRTRVEYYRQLDNAGKTADLTAFVEYAIIGFRDGLLETLGTIQENQFVIAWRSYIYDQFAERKYRKVVFNRRRKLALKIPLHKPVGLHEIMTLDSEIPSLYPGMGERTFRRDLAELIEMGLVRLVDGMYIANSDILRLQMARRRASVPPERPS